MSFSEIRARAGSDIQIDTINKLIQDANMSEAIDEQITISDKISPITILRDKLTVTDVGMMTCRVKPRNDSFVSFMPFEPDGKFVRLDLKFDSGGEHLTDHSYMQNIVDLGYDTRQAVLIKGSSDDGVTAGKISAILDGVQHYYKAKVTPKNSIKQMVTDGFPGFCFIYRCYPLSILNMQRSVNTQRAVPVDFIENDSVQYAVRVEIDDIGRVFFYVRHNYQDYYLSTSTKMVDIASNIPNYFSPDYDMDNYDASTEQFQIIYPVSYVDIGFTFDFATKRMQIYKNGILVAQSSTYPSLPALANLSLWLPMNEGEDELLHDISGLNNNATFSATANRKPTWMANNGRRTLSFEVDDYASLPNSASLNTFTTGWTISFFMKLGVGYFAQNVSKYIFGHGSESLTTGAILIYGQLGNSRQINIAAYNNSNVTRFVPSNSTALPATEGSWAHVVATYDGTDYKLYVNKILVGSLNAPGDSHTKAATWSLGHPSLQTATALATLSHIMVWKNVGLTQAQINDVYDIIEPQLSTPPTNMEFIPGDFVPPQEANLSLWLPMNESLIGESVKDISGLNNHGTFATSLRKPVKTTRDGRARLEFAEDGDYMTVPKNASLNSLTSFTISFFMDMYSDYYSIAHSKILICTAFAGGNGTVLLYTPAGNDHRLSIDVRTTTGTVRFLGSGSALSMLPNAPGLTHVVLTYDGLAYRFYIDGVQTSNTHFHTGDEFTNANDFQIGSHSVNFGGHQDMLHVMFWKNKALTLSEIQEINNSLRPTIDRDTIVGPDLLPANIPVFPPGYEEPPPPPAPGTPYQEPFEKIYDNTVIVSPTITEGKKINKITVSNQTSIYNVAKGTEVADPLVPVYDVPHGIQTDTTTTTPVNTVYNGTPTSSHGAIDSGKVFYGQRIKTTSSSYYNKPVTDLTLYLSEVGLSGVAKLGIMKNDGTFIQFGTDIPMTDIGVDTAINRKNYTHGHTMAVGDAFGVFMDSDEGLEIQRCNAVDSTNSCQSRHDGVGGVDGWQDNTSFHCAALVKDGGIVTGAVVNPWVELSNNSGARYQAANVFVTGAVNLNKKIHRLEFCVWRDATVGPGTPTIQLLHLTSTNTIKSPGGTLLSQNISSLPTTRPATFNFTWENINYDNALLVNERIVIQVTGLTTGKVYVEYNNGENTGAENHDTNKSYLTYRAVTGGAWGTSTTFDLSGKMFTGGNDFIPYIRLDHSRKRVGIKLVNSLSDLIGQKITKVAVPANKDNTPIDAAIYCRIRSSAGALRATIGQVDSSNVAETDTVIEFLNTGNQYACVSTDIITIEYDQGTATDYIKIGIDKNMYDGADTILCEALTANVNSFLSVTDRDLAAQLWVGGQVDPIARPARGFKINNNSVAMGEPVTEIRARFKRTGTFAVGDKVTCKIIRWTTKGTVITMGEKVCNDISSSAFVEYTFQNTNNAYPMEVGDLISFECNFGNSTTQFIEIQVSTPTSQSHAGNKDGIFTAMFEYNGQTYDDDLLRDVVGSLWIGGFMVFPDPSIPIPPSPYHHYHGWHFSAALPNDSGGIIDPDLLKPKVDSYFNNISDQLRMYSRVLTSGELINYYQNRWTISGIGYGGIEVVGWDFVPYDEAL